nr:hypothetical transcript [Hymenolepis microstoma]
MLLRRILRQGLVSPLVLWRSLESTSSRAVLPDGSTLHRINEYFTPPVESHPEFSKVDLDASLLARGLMKLHSEKILDAIRSLPAENWFNADVGLENRPGAIRYFDVVESTLENHHLEQGF